MTATQVHLDGATLTLVAAGQRGRLHCGAGRTRWSATVLSLETHATVVEGRRTKRTRRVARQRLRNLKPGAALLPT